LKQNVASSTKSAAHGARHAPGQGGAYRLMFLDQRGNPGRHAVRDLGFGDSGDSIVVASSIEMRALGEPRRREVPRDAANVTCGGHTRQRD